MNVWIISEVIDLGSHMVKAFASYDKAKAEFDRMTAREIDAQTSNLLRLGCKQEIAELFAKNTEHYILECIGVEE